VPVSHALKRLVRVRELEEERSRLALDSAVAERDRLTHALELASHRERNGRALIVLSAHSGELCDRLAGLEETRMAHRLRELLFERIAAAELEVSEQRERYLSTRIKRRQADTLIEEAERKDAEQCVRRDQQDLDEWFRSRA
jgi:thioredoxin-related protein